MITYEDFAQVLFQQKVPERYLVELNLEGESRAAEDMESYIITTLPFIMTRQEVPDNCPLDPVRHKRRFDGKRQSSKHDFRSEITIKPLIS